MKLSEMSSKAKEKHADYLLKFSNNMLTAFFITVLVSPLGVILTHLIKGTNTTQNGVFENFTSWQGISFILVEMTILFIAIETQDKAYKIYNSLHENNT